MDDDAAGAGGVPLLAGGEEVVLGVVGLGDPEGAVGAAERDRPVDAEDRAGREVDPGGALGTFGAGGEQQSAEEVGESSTHG